MLGVPRARRADDGEVQATGCAVAIASAAVAAGSAVEIAGRIGDDADGDAVVLDLARRGIGHAALLRVGGLATSGTEATSVRGLAAADVELALRYLPGYRVVVVAEELEQGGIGAAVEAASWAGAHLVVVSESDRAVPGLPDASTVLLTPHGDPDRATAGAPDGTLDRTPAGTPDRAQDGAFAALVGAYSAALDRGIDPKRAFAEEAARFNPEHVDE